jgi:solute carrier family 25 phosphate transporter 23/24/25/41
MVEEIYYQEGLTSFWKGNGTNLIRVFPFSATELFSFEVYKYFISKILDTLGYC